MSGEPSDIILSILIFLLLLVLIVSALGMAISAISVFCGLVLAVPMSYFASIFFGNLILGEDTPLDFAFSRIGLAITLLVTFAFGWLASRIPARKAVQVSTQEALAYE